MLSTNSLYLTFPDYRDCGAILASSSLRGNKGAREQLPWQSSPRAPAPGASHLRFSRSRTRYRNLFESRPKARKTATSSGECGLIRIGLQHAPLAQPVHLRIGPPEAAEDLGICWPSFGATVRTGTLSPILIGMRMCGISPSSGSLAY